MYVGSLQDAFAGFLYDVFDKISLEDRLARDFLKRT